MFTTTAPTDYLAALQSYMHPDNGTVPFYFAKTCADLMHLSDAFSAEYGFMEENNERVDLGEFSMWAIKSL